LYVITFFGNMREKHSPAPAARSSGYSSRQGAKAQSSPRKEKGFLLVSVAYFYQAQLAYNNPFFFLCVLCALASFA
jgi:hypothetical protein